MSEDWPGQPAETEQWPGAPAEAGPTIPQSGPGLTPGIPANYGPATNPNADTETGILHAFGQAFHEAAGPTEQLGLSDESVAWLRKAGYFTGPDSSNLAKPFQGFFEAITRPAAAALDSAWRGSQGLFRGTEEAAVTAGVPRDVAAALMGQQYAGSPGELVRPRPEVVPAPIRPVEGAPTVPLTRSAAARTSIPEVDAVLQSQTTQAAIDNAVIDRSHTVPYMAGGSTPLEDPTVYIDKHVPKEQTAPRLSARQLGVEPGMIEGKPFKPAIQIGDKTYSSTSHLDAMEDAGKEHGTDAVGISERSDLKYGWEQDGKFFTDRDYISPWAGKPKIPTVTFDPAEPWAIHENVEQHTMELLIKGGMTDEEAYRVAHFEFAEKAEQAWYRAHDIDQEAAEKEQQSWLPRIQHEAIPGQGGPVTYTTAKGSTYEVHDDGTTTRNKAYRPEHGEAEQGPQPRSDRTVYVKPDDAQRLALPQGGTARVIEHPNGTLSVATKNSDGRWGIAPSARNVPFETKPSVGVNPIELWKKETINGLPGYKTIHLGNEITEIKSDGGVPENLYKKPYPHANVKGAQHESVEEAQPSPEEVVRAKDIIRKAAGPPITSDLRVAKDLGIIGPERPSVREGTPEEAARNAVPGITAYHGSPHSFEAFDMGKIGTGEGAQSYGHGLYFAERPEVARSYQQVLADQTTINGRPFDINNPLHKAVSLVDEFGSRDAAIREARARQEHDLGDFYPSVLRHLKSGKELPKIETTGNMYQVRIHADPERMLDWDKPLSEQSEHVRAALKSMGIKSDGSGAKLLSDIAGQAASLKTTLTQNVEKSFIEASAAMREAGIPGIKYLDQGSRETGGTRNFVVFDHNDVEITHRNGEPTKPPAPPAPPPQPPGGGQLPPELPPGRSPWRERFDKFVGKLTTGDDVKALIQHAADEEQEFPAARRGDLTLAETQGISTASGIPSDQLDLAGIGRLLKNDNQVRAAMKLMIKTSEDLHLAMQQAAAKGGVDDLAELTELQAARMRHSLAVEQIAGLRAEWGRTGNVFQEFLESSKEAQTLGKFLADKKGESIDDLRELAKRGAAMDPRTELPGFMNEARKPPTFLDKLHWYWVNGLISGLITHTGYGAANYLYSLQTHGLATPLAAMIGKARAAIGAGEADRVFFGEGAAAVWGFHAAAPTALTTSWRAAKAGLKTPLAAERALVDAALARGEKPPKSMQRNVEASETPQARPIEGKLGRAIGLPGDMAGAIHGFYKNMGYDASVASQAYRQAVKEGLNPLSEGFFDRIDYWRKNPTEAMMSKGIDDAYAGTFMQELGTKGKAFNAFVKETPGMRWIFPFRHIPLNLLKATYEWSPLAFFDKDMRANLMGENGGAARDLAAAKMIIGTSIMSHFANLYMNGQATGEYPDDPKERDSWRLAGKQPNSLLIGGEWWSMQRLGPAGQLAQLGANIGRVVEGLRGGQDNAMVIATTRAVEAASHFVSDAPGFQTLQNYFDSRNDPKKWTRFVASEAGTFLPYSSFEKQAASFTDPYMREVKTFVDGIKYSVPGARETLLPKRDWSGQPVENPGFRSIIRAGTAITDPVDQELERLGVHAAPPPDRIGGVKLPPQLYDQYQATAGPFTRQALQHLVTNPSWPTLPAFQRAQVMRETITATRKAAQAAMQMAHPELIQAGVQAKVNKLLGQPAPPLQQ